MRAALLATVLAIALPGAASAGSASAASVQTRVVTGQAGILGEWDLTATVTRTDSRDGVQWIGPLTLKHSGFCSADGPEEKTGELRLQIPDPPATLNATLVIEHDVCTFSGKRQDGYAGVITCPDRRSIPLLLMLE